MDHPSPRQDFCDAEGSLDLNVSIESPATRQSIKEAEESLDLNVSIESPAIRRLIEEVGAEALEVRRSYNRTFNRHNR